MPGHSGKLVTLALGKQSAKGTPAVSAAYKLKLTGGDLGPVQDFIQLAETDVSPQGGKTLKVGAHVEGSPEFYVRPDDFGLLGLLLLGTSTDSGTNPNYVHTQSRSAAGPAYFTVWKWVDGVLVDKYQDCRITGAKISGQAGQALTCSIDIYGLLASFGATDDPATVVVQDPLVYPQVTVTKGGSAPGSIESFELNLSQAGAAFQGDKQLNPYDYIVGPIMCSGTISMLFESDSDYRKFHTGSAGGTAWSGTPTAFAESMDILAQVNTNLSVEFVMASVAYTEYPVPADPGGGPIRVAMGFRAQPDPTMANYYKQIVKNAVATY